MQPEYETWGHFFFSIIVGVLAISLYFLPLFLFGAEYAAGQDAPIDEPRENATRRQSRTVRGPAPLCENKPERIVNKPGLGISETLEVRGAGSLREIVRVVPELRGVRATAHRVPLLRGRDTMKRRLSTRRTQVKQARRPTIRFLGTTSQSTSQEAVR